MSNVKHTVNVGGINRIIELKGSNKCKAMFQQVMQNKSNLSTTEFNQLMSFLNSQQCTIN